MLKSVTADVLAVTRNALYAFYIYSGAVNFLHLIVESAVRRDNVCLLYTSCKFSLAVEKDGKVIAQTDNAGNGDGQKYSGSIAFTPIIPEKLKDYYIVTAKAKNSSCLLYTSRCV